MCHKLDSNSLRKKRFVWIVLRYRYRFLSLWCIQQERFYYRVGLVSIEKCDEKNPIFELVVCVCLGGGGSTVGSDDGKKNYHLKIILIARLKMWPKKPNIFGLFFVWGGGGYLMYYVRIRNHTRTTFRPYCPKGS